LKEKHGQIAHLDDDRANYAKDNLAFLCMEHHSLYDSETSQHKNYTIQEVKRARTMLCEAIARGEHVLNTALAPAISAKLYDLKISALQELWQALTKGHYEINRRAKAVMPQTEEEYRTQVEVHEFRFLDAMTMAEIYLDKDTLDRMRAVLGSLRQMCTSIWLRLPAVLEAKGKYADPEIREPDWKLFTQSFEAAKATLKGLLNGILMVQIFVPEGAGEIGAQVWVAHASQGKIGAGVFGGVGGDDGVVEFGAKNGCSVSQ
jgi:hypothetical protein